MKKLLFLDIDGVLNCWKECPYRQRIESKLSNRCCLFLKEIVDKTGCLIVVTSSWRNMPLMYDEFISYMHEKYNIDIFSKTENLLEGERCNEIENYIKNTNESVKFAILDDEDTASNETLKPYFVKTSGMENEGLTENNKNDVIHILG